MNVDRDFAGASMTRRTRTTIVATALVLLLGFWRLMREAWPSGACPLKYCIISQEAGIHYSPNRTKWIRIRYLDAGGLHSGNHLTWIAHYDWYRGWHTVKSGYSELEFLDEASTSLRWLDERRFVFPFCEGRYQSPAEEEEIRIDCP